MHTTGPCTYTVYIVRNGTKVLFIGHFQPALPNAYPHLLLKTKHKYGEDVTIELTEHVGLSRKECAPVVYAMSKSLIGFTRKCKPLKASKTRTQSVRKKRVIFADS